MKRRTGKLNKKIHKVLLKKNFVSFTEVHCNIYYYINLKKILLFFVDVMGDAVWELPAHGKQSAAQMKIYISGQKFKI